MYSPNKDQIPDVFGEQKENLFKLKNTDNSFDALNRGIEEGEPPSHPNEFRSYRRLPGANRSVLATSLSKTDPGYEYNPDQHASATQARAWLRASGYSA